MLIEGPLQIEIVDPVPLEMELVGEEPSLRGSLFAELRLAQDGDWEKVMEVMEEVTCEATEAVFPECTRGERQDSGCYLPHTGFHVVRTHTRAGRGFHSATSLVLFRFHKFFSYALRDPNLLRELGIVCHRGHELALLF